MKTLIRRAAIILAALAMTAHLGAQATNVTGEWLFNVQTDQGGGTPTLTFKQDGEKLTGKYTGQLGSADLTGTVKGNAIHFTFTIDVSPGVVMASAPWAAPYSTAAWGPLPSMKP